MSLTGFAVNGICAFDAAAAMQSIAQTYPQISGNYLYSLDNISGSSAPSFSFTLSEAPLPSGTVISNSYIVQLVSCDPVISTTPFFDGMTMGWGVVAAMAVASSIIFLKNSFYR
jgi:hypothetical protein